MKQNLLLHAVIGIAQKNGIATITELADRTGFKRTQISAWLSGRVNITLKNFLVLAETAGAQTAVKDRSGAEVVV